MPLRPLPTRLLMMMRRLQAADVRVEILAVLLGPPVHPFAVEPEHRRVVPRDQLLQLRLHVGDVLGLLRPARIFVLPSPAVGSLSGAVGVLRRVVPVHDRVVEAELQALALRFGGERLASRLSCRAWRRRCRSALTALSNIENPSWCFEVITMYFMPASFAMRTHSAASKFDRVELRRELLVLARAGCWPTT